MFSHSDFVLRYNIELNFKICGLNLIYNQYVIKLGGNNGKFTRPTKKHDHYRS